ncbi:hypothetical protein EJ06DRAFT_371653 [Trichodelitschia bisporula]|uniref:Uncharacterized protein n=1 Tax=Trichodelitschia bisporula TaxID=703511 RepID=A0A6G1I1R2_9PEZI|nr:hypothetical protein EJ06DRAFT_371653 [Trichodelitschia bisporula]
MRSACFLLHAPSHPVGSMLIGLYLRRHPFMYMALKVQLVYNSTCPCSSNRSIARRESNTLFASTARSMQMSIVVDTPLPITSPSYSAPKNVGEVGSVAGTTSLVLGYNFDFAKRKR